MKQKVLLTILVIMLVVASFFAGRFSVTRSTGEFVDTIAPKIEKYFISNDSLLRINDSINIKVVEVEKTYETTIDDIIRNNPRDDYDFFSTYVERYRGDYNTDTIKNS
jgi:Asp/Glu/hydantoin racemase